MFYAKKYLSNTKESSDKGIEEQKIHKAYRKRSEKKN